MVSRYDDVGRGASLDGHLFSAGPMVRIRFPPAASLSLQCIYRELCAELHNRMPVVLKPDVWPTWLGQEPVTLPDLKAMLAPYLPKT